MSSAPPRKLTPEEQAKRNEQLAMEGLRKRQGDQILSDRTTETWVDPQGNIQHRDYIPETPVAAQAGSLGTPIGAGEEPEARKKRLPEDLSDEEFEAELAKNLKSGDQTPLSARNLRKSRADAIAARKKK